MRVVGHPSRSGRADVYLHIGLAKTGTTHLQQVLWVSRHRLADDGVLVPGRTSRSQTLAVWDLMGRRTRGAEQPDVAGSWQALVDAAANWAGSHVLVSEEFLANARPGQVRRAVRAFAPAQVHVVVTVRDLSHVIGSAWQQELAKGRTWSWEEFLGAVREPERGPATAGVAFWLRHDVLRVLDTWEVAVPRERIHVVTVPPPGAPLLLLQERFAAASRLEPGALTIDHPLANESIGVTEAEVLRRVNIGLGGRLNERQYIRAVQQGVKPALRVDRSSPRIRLPVQELGWVAERATAVVAELRSRGYEVTGDLEDLVPTRSAGDGEEAGEAGAGDLAEAALAALVAVTEKYAEVWWRTRRPGRPVEGTGAQRVLSAGRAVAYRARVASLEAADRSRLASRLVNAYLRRSSR